MNRRRKQLRTSWFYHNHTQQFLHWLWIFSLLGLMIYFSFHFIRKASQSPAAMSLVIQDPHFYSFSKTNKPYHIYAESMVYNADAVSYFSKPCAECDFTQSHWSMRSYKGGWDHQEHTLTLEKRVHLQDQQGQHLYTDFAQLLYKKKEIYSHKSTSGSSPKGDFHSAGFLLNAQTLDLTGPVTFTFYPPQHTKKSR